MGEPSSSRPPVPGTVGVQSNLGAGGQRADKVVEHGHLIIGAPHPDLPLEHPESGLRLRRRVGEGGTARGQQRGHRQAVVPRDIIQAAHGVREAVPKGAQVPRHLRQGLVAYPFPERAAGRLVLVHRLAGKGRDRRGLPEESGPVRAPDPQQNPLPDGPRSPRRAHRVPEGKRIPAEIEAKVHFVCPFTERHYLVHGNS